MNTQDKTQSFVKAALAAEREQWTGRSCPPKGERCSACGGAYVCLQWRRNPLVKLNEKRDALHKRMLRADVFGSNALADANQASERGNATKAEAAYARGQKWLDQSNNLRDQLIEIDAAIAKAGSAS